MRHEFEIEHAVARSRLHQIAIDLAEVKAELAARRFVAELKKYNASQPRAPRGTPTGGQWVDAGGGNSSRQGRAPPIAAAPKVKVPRPVLRNTPIGVTEAAPAAARAVGLPVAAGVVGVSRAAGAFENATTGRSVTPVLKVPFSNSPATAYGVKPWTRTTAGPGPSDGNWKNGYAEDDECEKARDDDLMKCQINSAMYGRTRQEKKELYEVCRKTAMTRYSECRASGTVAGRKTPLFQGGF